MKNKLQKISFCLLLLIIFVAILVVNGHTNKFESKLEFSTKYVGSNLEVENGYLKPSTIDIKKNARDLHTLALSTTSTSSTDLSDVKAAITSMIEKNEVFDDFFKLAKGDNDDEIVVLILQPNLTTNKLTDRNFWPLIFTEAKGISKLRFPDAPEGTFNPVSTSSSVLVAASFNANVIPSLAKTYGIKNDAIQSFENLVGKFVYIELWCPDASNLLKYKMVFVKAKNNVKWVSDGTEISEPVAYGEKITMPDDIKNKQVDGKVLDSWTKTYTDTTYIDPKAPSDAKIVGKTYTKELSQEDLANEKMGKFDVTYTANWVEAINVKFHYNDSEWNDGSETTKEVAQVDGKNWRLPEKNPDGDKNHTFLGWYTSATYEDEVTADTIYSKGINDVYARWETQGFSIDFYDRGTLKKHTVKERLLQNDAPSLDSREGYEFLGWSTTQENGQIYQFSNTELKENVTLYAQWKAIKYPIHYDLADGTENDNPNEYTIEENVDIKDPTRVGYTFDGWSTTPGGSDRKRSFVIIKGSTGEKHLYAHWTPLTYRIRFEKGIAGSETITGDVREQVLTFDDFSKKISKNYFKCKGYSFAGWKIEGNEKIYEDQEQISTNLVDDPTKTPIVTLTATWAPKTYSIGLDLNPTLGQLTKYYPVLSKKDKESGRFKTQNQSSTVPSSYYFSYVYATELEQLPIPERLGYIFDGWYYESKGITIGSGDKLSEKLSDYDWEYGITLKAHWTRRENMPVKVEYHIQNLDGSYTIKEKTFDCGNIEQGKWLGPNYTKYYSYQVDADKYKDVSGTVLSDAVLKELGIDKGFKFNPSNKSSILSNAGDSEWILSLYFDRETYKVIFEIDKEKTEKTYCYQETVKVPDISKFKNDDHVGYRNVYWTNKAGEKIEASTLKDFPATEDASYTLSYEKYYEAKIGDVTYRTLGIALQKAQPGDIVIPNPDENGNLTATMEENKELVVPSGVMLLIPCKENDTGYDEKTKFNPDGDASITDSLGKSKDAKLYKKIIIPKDVTLVVNGTVLVNAVTGRPHAGHYDMDVTGGYGEIELEGNVLVKNGGIFDVCGYVNGNGTITAESGGEVRDLYIVRNWRGGSFAFSATIDNSIYPMNEADMHNISVTQIINSGAKLVGTVKMYASSSYHYTRFPQIDNENGLIRIQSGTVTKTYKDGREKYDLNGAGSIDASALEIIEGIKVSTGEYLYPIDGDIDFNITGNWVVNERLKFMPGVNVTITDGSTIEVAKTTKHTTTTNKMVFYDEFDDSGCGGTAYPNRSAATVSLDGGVTVKISGSFAGQIIIKESATKENPTIIDLTSAISTKVDTKESSGTSADNFSVHPMSFKTYIGTSKLMWSEVEAGNKYKCYYEDGVLIIEGMNEQQEKHYTGSPISWEGIEGSFEYKKVDEETWSSGSPIEVGKYLIRQILIDGNGEKVVVNLGTLSIVPQALSTPKAVIDYSNETLTGLEPGTYSIVINGDEEEITITIDEDGIIPLDSKYFGKDITIVHIYEGDNVGYTNSAAQKLTIPARPTKLNDLQVVDPSAYGESNGKITGLDSEKVYEYRLLLEGEWNTVEAGSKEIDDLAAGNYEVRLKATENSFASSAVTLLIENPPLKPQIEGAPDIDFASDDDIISDGILTEEDKNLTKQGVEIEIKLTVEDITDSVSKEDKILIQEAMKNYNLGEYLEVELHKIIKEKDVDVLISEVSHPIQLCIQVPKELLNHNLEFSVVRLHDGKAVLLPDLDKNPETITIETDKFSVYALVYRNIPVDKTNLEKNVSKAKELKENKYTKESWNVLLDALTKASKVLNNKEATKEQVNEATTTLVKAMNSLKKVTSTSKEGQLVGGYEATETKTGRKSYYVCDDKWYEDKACTKEIKDHDSIVIPKKEHKALKVEAKDPTETENGNIEYWYCSSCNKYFKDEAMTQEITKEETILAATGKKELSTETSNEVDENSSKKNHNYLFIGIVCLLLIIFFLILLWLRRKKEEEDEQVS